MKSTSEKSESRPTAVGGSFKSGLFIKNAGFKINSENLKYPPTAVSGIRNVVLRLGYRKDLNDPPTAVGGIRTPVRMRGLGGPHKQSARKKQLCQQISLTLRTYSAVTAT